MFLADSLSSGIDREPEDVRPGLVVEGRVLGHLLHCQQGTRPRELADTLHLERGYQQLYLFQVIPGPSRGPTVVEESAPRSAS